MKYEGTDEVAELLPNIVYAPAALRLNERAGVVVDEETDVLKSGERLPDENEVTVPDPPPVDDAVTRVTPPVPSEARTIPVFEELSSGITTTQLEFCV